MPKKRDGSESKKTRKSSSAAKDNASPMATSDIVPPPTPQATHLVASNPFDDTFSSNPVKMMHNYPNQPMMHMGGGMGPGYPGWAASNPRSGLRPPFSNSGAPGWNSNVHGTANMGPMYNPNIPHNGYGPYAGPGMPSYRGSPRMPMGNVRPGMPPIGPLDNEGLMSDPSMGPSHLVSSGNHGHMLQNTGQMKALTRPNMQMPSTNIRKGSSSSSKNLSNDSKSPKASSDGSLGKQRKKSEKKSALESKARASEAEKLAGVNESSVAPHAIPPKEPQNCKQCSRAIDYPNEDAVRCLASCNAWYHRTCVGLTPEALKYLKMEECAIWACDYCLHSREMLPVITRPPLLEGQVVFG